ncbi:MAG: FxDxF family PEP-CTERM protein, partial [Rhodocyclaceae bacterium]|nr:FxDxF family PEP-CTERM protein [Rhodocyclaceae bacterium]
NTGGVSLSIAAVPEPETWGLLLAGLGLLGVAARRRA